MPELTRVPCPECGEPNLPTDTVCLRCGKALRVMPRPPMRPNLKRAGLPMVSGRMSALVLGLCFALSAVLIPVAAHLPRWVEFELVLGAWWVVWAVALGGLLYRGLAVDDDAPPSRVHVLRSASNTDSWCAPDGCCAIDGCFSDFAALAVALLAIWLLIEFAIPAVAFMAYLLIRRMLAVVVNDDNGSQGRLSRALGWAVWYATLYTAPLAFVVWVVHAATKHVH